MIYPLIFEPINKTMIWGSESWDISCRENEMGIISNGTYKGEKFIDIINKNKECMLGSDLKDISTFPLLIKRIIAKDKLSVQVHPDDRYAKLNENVEFGKTEIWYVTKAPEDSKLIVGLKENVTKEFFKECIYKGEVTDCLREIKVKKGDFINIPSGLVHAITNDIGILEIQQNSDITYRVYDYDRVDKDGNKRELHINKALDVINFNFNENFKIKGLDIAKGENKQTYYLHNKYFSIIKLDITNKYEEFSFNNKFHILSCISGSGYIESNYNNKKIITEFKKGESIFFPAKIGFYKIVGKSEFLKSFCSGEQTEFTTTLLQNGYSADEINCIYYN